MGLPALTRRRLLRLVNILALSALIGAAYGVRMGAAPSALANAVTGVVNGAVIAGGIAAIEMFGLRAPSLRWLSTLPFALLLLLKMLLYGGIAAAVILGAPGEWLVGMETATTGADILRTVGFSLLLTSAFVIAFHAGGLVGYRTFRDLLLGKYRRPHPERRFFLFVDLVGSTGLAEHLGPLAAHRFLGAVFAAIAEPVAAHGGEIYQYVGDEVVVTWTEGEGTREARPLDCFFDMRAALARRAAEFRRSFGLEPELRAALHFGEVIAGEIGEERRAIVFHGDVMNTAARLEQATREVGCRFIASEQALQALGPLQRFRCRDLGVLQLRGRRQPMRAFGVESAAATAAA